VQFAPMPLVRIPEPFDHPERIFELKLDGFRALAHIDGHHCRLASRNGHTFKSWPYVQTELAHAIRCDSAVLDGEIVAFDNDGRPNFQKLLFRREWPHFCAFDVLMLNGRDLRQLPLIERKARLKTIMSRMQSRVRYVEHIAGTGSAFYALVCERDLEGVVAKWRNGTYQTAGRTSWLKIQNPNYTRRPVRRQVFATRL
jgi:bifunctional non-homologous end joining protein LigD